MSLYKCNFCEFHTSKRSNFARHLESVKHLMYAKKDQQEENSKEDKDDKKDFICQHCQFKFNSKYSLSRHQSKRCKELKYQNSKKQDEKTKLLGDQVKIMLDQINKDNPPSDSQILQSLSNILNTNIDNSAACNIPPTIIAISNPPTDCNTVKVSASANCNF